MTAETPEETIVRVTIEEHTRPAGEGPYRIAVIRPQLAHLTGLPETTAVEVAERLAKAGVIRRETIQGRVCYERKGA
jgi:predicted transcriptional regulator